MKSAAHPHLVQHGIQEGALTPALECDIWNACSMECQGGGDVTSSAPVVTMVAITFFFSFVVFSGLCAHAVFMAFMLAAET